MDIAERIKIIRGDIPQEEFAKLMGIHKSSIGRYERGDSVPDMDFASKICSCFGISTSWLLFGTGEMKLSSEGEKCSASLEEFTAVPKVAAQLAAGGGSFITSDDVVEYFDFRTDWLRTKGSIKDMVLMDVSGDSMEPEIHDRDMVLIDQSKRNLMPGRIFAIGIEDAIYVKYLDTQPGKIILRSENEKYSDIIIDTSEDLENQIRIIGRVLWVCREY